MSREDRQAPPPGGPARIFAGLAFFYALAVTVGLLIVHDLFRDEPDSQTVLVWLLLPLLSSFGCWIGVRSGFSPLRAWVWFAVLASLFFVWIAAFSIGVFYLPVPLLLLIAVLIPWTEEPEEPARMRVLVEVPPLAEADEVSGSRAGGKEVSCVRRLLGDDLLETVLLVCTLGVGWLIWFALAARHGQTPAKQLVGVRIHDYETGLVASAAKVWFREICGKRLVPILLSVAAVVALGSPLYAGIAEVYLLAAGLLVLINDERLAIWDLLAGTIVRRTS